ncbi:MAG: hypothetical protein GPJ54_03620 [Candidatus Heimdallarchaeota archaeon]|nr:hypothetical protein [Candidatus Heimdallarchaeota archaeon]
MSSNLFSHLKEDLEHAKEEIIERKITFDLSKILVITDGFDDVDERFSITEKWIKRYDSEISRVYLYNLKGSLFNNPQEGERSVIESLRAHSNKIKELKSKDVVILFDDTVKNFLIESREIRQVTTEEKTEFSFEDVDALAEFFLEKSNREYNLIQEINIYIDEYKPNLVYWKPNLLEEREWYEKIGISNIENMILRHVNENSLVLLQGKNKFREANNVVCYIKGGEVELEFKKILNMIEVYFQDQPLNVTFCVIIDENTVNLATIFPDEKYSDQELRELIRQRISAHIKQFRIFDKAPNQKIQFGTIEQELDVILRELNADVLIVSPKYLGEDKFGSNALGVIKIAVKQGVGVLIII